MSPTNPRVEALLVWRVVVEAQELFGWENTFEWMLCRQERLAGQRPVDLLEKMEGREKILAVLEALKTGAFV